MNCFINNISNEKMRLTNGPWNKLGLNNPWAIGLVSKIIGQRTFKNKEEWEKYYFESGRERLKKIAKLPLKYQVILLDPHGIEQYNEVPYEYRKLNYDYGRTKEDLSKLAHMLQGYLCSNPKLYKEIGMYDVVQMVRFRALRETWNGIIIREQNTIKVLQEILKNQNIDYSKLKFVSAEGEEDAQYAIDYKLYYDNEYLLALQIKPVSYMNNNKSYIKEIKKINKDKHMFYKKKTNIDTLYIYSGHNGQIKNKNIINTIVSIIKNRSKTAYIV